MKKLRALFAVLVLSSLFPSAVHSAYLIHLENGGRFTTPLYWEDSVYIMFYVPGGLMGVEKKYVRKIERSNLNLEGIYEVGASAKQPAEAQQKAEKNLSSQNPPEKIDLKAYQDKMAKLKAELNRTLTRIRKATKDNDLGAKDEATADNRRISAEMWKLTDELEKKNSGKLPPDWWEGVGQEAPATP